MVTHPLSTFRKHAELSQKQLGRALGVSRTTVARWETGTRKIGHDFLPKVVALTDIPAKQLRPDLAELMEVSE